MCYDIKSLIVIIALIMPDYPSYISSKLPHQGASIFTTMSALANKHNAINLSQGFPDEKPPRALITLVANYMRKGNNQYAPMAGVLKLREQLAAKAKKLYGLKYDAESEITITAGATQAINATMMALIKEGDEVIILQPAYDSYAPSVVLAGGRPKFFDLTLPDYKIDWDQMKMFINGRTKMIIVNNPHNPSGAVLSKQDLEELDKIIAGRDIIVLSDEVYEHLIYDDATHESVMNYPNLQSKSVVIFSFGKTYNCTGWKIGYCFAPKGLTKEIRKIHQFQVFSANKPIQMALADFLSDEEYYLNLKNIYQEKRNYFAAALSKSKFELLPCKGSYFQLASYENITQENDFDFCVKLTKKHGVAAIPISSFYQAKQDHKVIRFCFAKQKKVLKKAAQLLCNI